MRILTVRQPWAWAIIQGQKDVENRTRNIAGSYRGPVLIHAAKQYDYTGATPTLSRAQIAAGGPSSGRPWITNLGHIIGVVDLVDVHRASECVYVGDVVEDFDGNFVSQEVSYCSPWAQAENVEHLVFANPRALDEPIPYKGGLGLRKTNFDIAGDWLYEETDRCTCGIGNSIGALYGHEPGCGLEPVARLQAVTR